MKLFSPKVGKINGPKGVYNGRYTFNSVGCGRYNKTSNFRKKNSFFTVYDDQWWWSIWQKSIDRRHDWSSSIIAINFADSLIFLFLPWYQRLNFLVLSDLDTYSETNEWMDRFLEMNLSIEKYVTLNGQWHTNLIRCICACRHGLIEWKSDIVRGSVKIMHLINFKREKWLLKI